MSPGRRFGIIKWPWELHLHGTATIRNEEPRAVRAASACHAMRAAASRAWCRLSSVAGGSCESRGETRSNATFMFAHVDRGSLDVASPEPPSTSRPASHPRTSPAAPSTRPTRSSPPCSLGLRCAGTASSATGCRQRATTSAQSTAASTSAPADTMARATTSPRRPDQTAASSAGFSAISPQLEIKGWCAQCQQSGDLEPKP